MKKETLLLITAGIIFTAALLLFLVSWFVQPILPSPWNNILMIAGVVFAAVLAALSGIADTFQIVERLWGKKPEEQAAPGYQATLEGDGALAQGEGSKALGERAIDASGSQIDGSLVSGKVSVGSDFVGRDKIEGNQVVIIAEKVSADFWQQYDKPKPDLEVVTKRYLTHLLHRYQYLDFKGMGVSDKVALRLPLLEMYVPLKARIEMPEGETWARQLRLAGRPVSEEEAEVMGQRLSEPQPVLDLLQQHDGLIILGDPGAGKSTFLKYLTVRLARGEGEALGLGKRLPVLLPLSAYANTLVKQDVPLHRFMAQYYQDLGIDEPLIDLLDETLRRGGGLLLLDGLDEVRSVSLRHTVVERVMDFFAYRQQDGNKFVLTSRIVGYREVRPTGTRMAECTLVDFDDEEIEQFVTSWTAALERAARGDTEVAAWEAAQERAGLMESIAHNRGVRQLAANPLLLTILALMKRQGVTLPERRVELYDKYVETLLKHWNLARGLGRPPRRDLDVVETVRVLAPLALWMHETSPGVGLVPREELRRRLEQIYADRQIEEPDVAARQLLTDAREYAGLLVERGAGMYGFIHLSFQEYLAAVAIGQQGQGNVGQIVSILSKHVGDDNWREVTLLTIGYMGIRQQLDKLAGKVLLRLIEAEVGEAGEAAVLAGEAVVDTWPGGVTPACRRQVTATLLIVLSDDKQVQPHRRARAGQVLARLDDPRREVLDVDAMPFCYVPEGPFWLGSDDGRDNEKPAGQMDRPYAYWLGQYPVSQAQFARFVEADGYKEAGYWSEAAERGYWQEDGRFKGRFDSDWRSGPETFGHPYNLPNHPVVGVTWYEAVAFCRWLTERWRAEEWLPKGWQVQLPSEAEWEKGARGGLAIPAELLVRPVAKLTGQPAVPLVDNPYPKRPYPWGEAEITPEIANYGPTGIKATSSIGCFPGNCSPHGLVEMSGNVWEWTRSKWKSYPYQAEERERLDSSDDRRVFRGGYYGNETWLRCASRYGYPPDDGDADSGFRVCVSPFPYATSGL